jgi:FAD/FMN-containing dehydrogenase
MSIWYGAFVPDEAMIQSRTSRRRLLQAAGAGAAALAVPPWLDRALAAPESATPLGRIRDKGWGDLARRLDGWLLRPGDAMYPAAATINAARYAAPQPQGIAVCVSPQDAAACVIWARDNGVPLAIRSGGHNYAGFSTTRGLLIDVRGMLAISVDQDAGTVTAAGGANNADAGAALKPYGLYFPGGRCPTVGLSGLTLGGGWGFSCRHLGMTCDSLVSTELVTANGEIVTASETENPDLFWAVRGAGGGNFGVHTSFTYKTVTVSEVTVFSLSWSGGETAALVDGLSRMQLDAPRELGLRLAVAPQSRMPRSDPAPLDIDLIGLYWGPQSDVMEFLAAVEQIQPADARTVRQMPFAAAREFLAATTPTGTYEIKTGFVRRALPATGIATMLEWINAMPGSPSRAQESTAGLYCWGGKVNDLAPDANAFVHRNADFLFKCEVLWEPQDPPDLITANLEWVEGFHAAMQPYLSGGAYQNFTDRGQTDWQDAYYGENFARLVDIKRAWDPANLFHFAQGIPARI